MKTYLDKLWEQKMDASYGKNSNNNVQGVLSLNYQFNEKHSMGVRYDMDKILQTLQATGVTQPISMPTKNCTKQYKYDDW